MVASLHIDTPLQEIIRKHDHKCDREQADSEKRAQNLKNMYENEQKRCENYKRRRERQLENIMSVGGSFNMIHEQHRSCSLVGVSGNDVLEKRQKRGSVDFGQEGLRASDMNRSSDMSRSNEINRSNEMNRSDLPNLN